MCVFVLPVSPGWAQKDWWVSGQAGCTWQAVGASWERPPSDDSSEEGAGWRTGEEQTHQIKNGLIPAEKEWKLCEIRRLVTIPYTGTWGVVIGKATGAGACAQQQEHNRLFLAELQFDLKLKADCKYNPDSVGLVSNLLHKQRLTYFDFLKHLHVGRHQILSNNRRCNI